MKLKFIFCLLSMCCLFSANAVKTSSNALAIARELSFYGNGIPYEIPRGSGGGSRSIAPSIPFSAFLIDGNMIELDFYEAIGEVDIVISQDETSIYSSSENIQSSVLKGIQLSSELSGRFLLEIKGANGAYAYAWFEL